MRIRELGAVLAVLMCPPSAATTPLRIHDIQGLTHESPWVGRHVSQVSGVVTLKHKRGFVMQDPQPDDDVRTSEAVYVYSGAEVSVGDLVAVSGVVGEFRPGGASGKANLSTTELRAEKVSVMANDQPLPSPVDIGKPGRSMPAAVGLARDPANAVGPLDPQRYAMDFFESMESMRITLTTGYVVGPSSATGALVLIATEHVPRLNPRGALVRYSHDLNPMRIIVEPAYSSIPIAKVGDRLSNVLGVLEYAFGAYRLAVTTAPQVVTGTLAPEVARQNAAGLSIASYNVENLDPSDEQKKFDRIAGHLVSHLRSPDLIGLLEVQDSSGPLDDGRTDARLTMQRLLTAIRAAGGPAYDWHGADPENNQDGGEPGGNIRAVFLYNPARLKLGATGRLAQRDGAFVMSRKPLYAEFEYQKKSIHVVLNHFVSKRADEPLFGLFQPPRRPSEGQRHRQAQFVADFAKALISSRHDVVVMGDLNDFDFSETLAIFERAGLYNPAQSLAPGDRYSYIYEGNAQLLDHILISDRLRRSSHYKVVHVNAEWPSSERASDHDPLLLTFD